MTTERNRTTFRFYFAFLNDFEKKMLFPKNLFS